MKKCVCTKTLNYQHLFQCKILNNCDNSELKYEDILNGTLHQKKHILNILKKNFATRDRCRTKNIREYYTAAIQWA